MTDKPNLSQFGTNSDSTQSTECDMEITNSKLSISQTYEEQFELHSFLMNYVLGDDFEERKDTKPVKINNDNDLINVIVDFFKAKKYIGVGVGGLYIYDIESTPHVLLYKRYHEPENQMWSILGGSSAFQEEIEDTLVKKISKITNIAKNAIKVKDIIRANNHKGSTFHYLSPSFYIDIKTPQRYLYWGEQENADGKKRKVEIIRKKSDFRKIGISTPEKPILAWVPVEMIIGDDVMDENGAELFAYTTLQALESHHHIHKETEKVVKATQTIIKATETIIEATNTVQTTISSYKDWRVEK